MSQSNRNVIAIIVEAENSTKAKANAIHLMTNHLLTPEFYRPVRYMEPCPIISSAADALLEGFWQTMRDGYVECIKGMIGAIALAEGDSDALLEDIDFRRACAQVGALEGRHILLYGPVMDPIITRDNLEELRQGLPQESGEPAYDPHQLWVVAIEITE